MSQSCLSSFQNVLILDLETLGSKVMNENVSQGFCCWRKSLIFCRGIFRTKKLQFFSIESLENASNHLKMGMNHPQDGFKKFLIQIFEILIFRDFFRRFGCSVAKKRHFFPISAAVKSAKIEISKFSTIIFCVYLQGSFMPIFVSIGPFSRDQIQFFCEKMLFSTVSAKNAI